MLQKLLSPARWSADATDYASLILRLTLGLLMLTHGYPKLLNLMSGDIKFGDPIGIGVTASLALTVFAEFVCSILLILGLGTRLAIVPLVITMIVAVFIVHASDPINKKEVGMMYLFPYIALFFLGSGKFSLDNFFMKK